MSSLRERLEAKKRRVAVYPVRVDDTTAAEEAVSVHTAALDLHVAMRPRLEQEATFDVAAYDAEVARLRGNVAEAKAALAACYADVEVQALPDDEFEALLASAERDEDGEPDLDDVRADLMAASCVDEDLRDVAWWKERLADPAWTRGEKLAMNTLLLGLNLHTRSGRQGNG